MTTTRLCAICNGPLPATAQPTTRYCGRPCKDLATFLAAAQRCIAEIVARDASLAPVLRARLRGMANKMGNDWQRPRCAGGRFLPKEG